MYSLCTLLLIYSQYNDYGAFVVCVTLKDMVVMEGKFMNMLWIRYKPAVRFYLYYGNTIDQCVCTQDALTEDL